MLPVRRIAPLAITAAIAITGMAPAAGSAAQQTGCQAGAITTVTNADASTTTLVCDRHGEQLETAAAPATPEQTAAARRQIEGGVSLSAASAKPQTRCAIVGSKKKGQAGTTLVVIVRTTKKGKTLQRTSTPYICGADSAWRQVTSPFAGVSLIATSTVITRTERA